MNQAEVVERWGMPFKSLLADLAAQGLCIRDAALALGVSYALAKAAVTRGGLGGSFEQSPKKSEVAIKYGAPFWSVVRSLQEQGLNRSKVAAELGFSRQAMIRMLIENPELDPWPPSGPTILSQFMIDTGGPLIAQVRDMASRGMTAHACGLAVGYAPTGSPGCHIIAALKARGVTDIEFPKVEARKKAPKEKRGDTWYSKHKGGPKTHLRDILRQEYRQWEANNERV